MRKRGERDGKGVMGFKPLGRNRCIVVVQDEAEADDMEPQGKVVLALAPVPAGQILLQGKRG